MKLFDTYKGLPKSVYVIFFAQIINRFGDFVLPFLTLFLVKKMGLSYESAGFAAMLASISSIPGSFAGGKIGDHFGRKKTYVIFQLSAAIAIFTCAFMGNPNIIIGLVCLSTFFNGGVRPIIGAIITDVLTPEKRQLGFSLSYLGINLGVALGPLVAGFLFSHYVPLIFIGDALTSFLAVALVASSIKETLPSHDAVKNVRNEEKAETGTVFDVLFRRPKIMVFLLINILLSTVYTQHTFSLPMMLDHVFGSGGPKNYGFVMSFNAITVLTLTMFVTKWTQKWKPLSAIALTGFLYACGFGMITFIHTMPLFILSTLIWTTGEILIVTNFGVYIANNTPQNFRARFNAVTSLSWAFGSIIGTYLMGKYMDLLGVEAVWPLLFVLGLAGAAGMYLLRLKTEGSDNTASDTAAEING